LLGTYLGPRGKPGRAAATLHIDWTRCDGRGLCVELLPELLTRDDWGYPVGGDGTDVAVPVLLQDAARDAMALCPVQALRLR
jgi:ferredoxin